jgi:4-amino-4-deoxy-L-arabinose transferase-like glycosyltransferase
LLAKKQWILFGLIILILLINNWSLPFWDQDEPAYAGFARTMNETGDYLIPDFYFSHDHRKTPLHFWDIALSFKIFGANEFATRLPSFLAILGTMLLMIFQGAKLIGKKASFNAVVVIGTSFLVTALAKVSVTDATVLFFSTLSAFGLINTLLNPNLKWGILFWLGISLGVLTKGPPIILFIGAFALILFIAHPNRKNLFKLHPWFFLPLAIAPVVLWGYLTTLRDGGEFLSWMYDWYVKQRVNGSVYDQEGPFGTHILLIFGFFLLSSMYFFNAFKDSIKGFFSKDGTLIILGAWFFSGWFFYEFSPSKLPAYVIVAHVPLALLMGNYLTQLQEKGSRPHIAFSIIHYTLNFIFGLALAVGPFVISDFSEIELNYNLCVALSIIGSLFIISLILQLIKFKQPKFFGIQSYSSVLVLLSLWTISPLFTDHINSSKQVSEYVLTKIDSNTEIIIAHSPGKQPSLPFYLGKQNNPIHIEENITKLLTYISNKKNIAIVANLEQFKTLDQVYPNMDYKIISTRIIDRKDIAEYYICIIK